jgi:O-acetyl-ADP-ribose deacetylase (regulator of RNase III)
VVNVRDIAAGYNQPVRLEVVEADITTLEVDAVVNAANDHLWMGAGVAGAIKRAGGVEIEREATAKGPIAVGEAVETTAGSLPARYVIHGAVMGQDLRTDPETIERTTRSCLELAQRLGARTIALPALGTGVGGVPFEASARAMVAGVRSAAADDLERVVFAVFGREALAAFRDAVES